MSFYEWRPYVSVEQRRRKAERTLASMRKKGQPISPVRIEEIVAVANEAEAKLRNIVRGVLERWPG